MTGATADQSQRVPWSFFYVFSIVVLYNWSIYEAYVFDAKTETGELWMYIVVYLGFTLLIRSYGQLLLMNGASLFVLPFILLSPIVLHAGSYFDFQPVLGWAATFVITAVQALLFLPVSRKFKLRLQTKFGLLFSAAAGLTITIVITTVSARAHMAPWIH